MVFVITACQTRVSAGACKSRDSVDIWPVMLSPRMIQRWLSSPELRCARRKAKIRPNAAQIGDVRHKCARRVIAKGAANTELRELDKKWRTFPQAKVSRCSRLP